MKYTVNIPQDIGKHPNTSHFLADTLQSIFVLLEQRGQQVSPLIGKKITPEILERLLLPIQKKSQKFSENSTVNAIFQRVEETGGLDGYGETIRELGSDFREGLAFRNDQ